MNITTQINAMPLATVVNPQTDSLRRENSQREVITQPTPTHASTAEKGVASDKDRARTPAQQNEHIDFTAIQKKAEEEKAKKFENERKPLFNKIIKEIPGKTGVFRREWESLVRKATTKEELNAINAQLSEKIKLRNEIRASNISNKEKSGHEAWIMKRGNDVSKRRQELTGQLKAKKNAANALKKNTASKLQALNKLEKANRTAFMARLNKGNTQKAILANATRKRKNSTSSTI